MFRKRAYISDEDLEAINEVEEEIKAIDLDILSINRNLETLEETNEFITNRISELNQEKIAVDAGDIEMIRFNHIKTLDSAKRGLSTFFALLLDLNVYKCQLEKRGEDMERAFDKLAEEHETLRAEMETRE